MSLPTTEFTTWHRPSFIISTNPILIPLDSLNAALDSSLLHWATALNPEELLVMVNNSTCFGLYDMNTSTNTSTSTSTNTSTTPNPTTPPLIGFARLITDKVTFAYLTDVYVLPQYAGRGLGTWLIDCVKEWLDTMPKLRQLVLITGKGKKEEYYARKLGTTRIENLKDTVGVLWLKGRLGRLVEIHWNVAAY